MEVPVSINKTMMMHTTRFDNTPPQLAPLTLQDEQQKLIKLKYSNQMLSINHDSNSFEQEFQGKA